MNNFYKLVDHFIQTDELGDYNEEDYSITLYDIENQPSIIRRIEQDIQKITRKYKFIVLNPMGEITNVKILDIDL